MLIVQVLHAGLLRTMNTERILFRSDLFTLAHFAHPCDQPHHDPPEEVAPVYSINFVDRGSFEVRAHRHFENFLPGSLFLTHPGFAFRCRHRQHFPDDACLSLILPAELDGDGTDAADLLRSRLALPPSPRSRFLRYALGQRIASADSLAVEELAAELTAALPQIVCDDRATTLARQCASTWYLKRVDRAREQMRVQPAAAHTLRSLARTAGVSPFHFARIFRALTGVPPHQYLVRQRLKLARLLLAQGASVTGACFASGFNHLGHFSRSFRRAFGHSPSQSPANSPQIAR